MAGGPHEAGDELRAPVEGAGRLLEKVYSDGGAEVTLDDADAIDRLEVDQGLGGRRPRKVEHEADAHEVEVAEVRVDLVPRDDSVVLHLADAGLGSLHAHAELLCEKGGL